MLLVIHHDGKLNVKEKSYCTMFITVWYLSRRMPLIADAILNALTVVVTNGVEPRTSGSTEQY